MSPNCCRRADCADHNCPGRGTEPPKPEPTNPASQEAVFTYVLNILAGIGAFSFVLAIVIWSVK